MKDEGSKEWGKQGHMLFILYDRNRVNRRQLESDLEITTRQSQEDGKNIRPVQIVTVDTRRIYQRKLTLEISQ